VVTVDDLAVNNQIAPVRTTSEPYVIDVTGHLYDLSLFDRPYAGFTLSGFPGGSGFAFRSSEPFVNAPILTITTVVPEPASIALLMLLSAPVTLSRRRR
jgi:hypothetical protein